MRFALLLALGGAAFAQESLKLTLKDAVALALKQNPRIILAQLETAQRQQDRALSRSALLPQASANVSETVHRVNLEAAIGFTFPNFPQHVGPYETFQAGGFVTAPVLDLTLWRRYRASSFSIDASRADELTAREESVLLVVSQYLGGQRAAADVQAALSRVELAQALYDLAADLQKNGVGTGIDTLRSNVQLQNEKQRLIVARTQLETSLFGLARLLSIDPLRKIELADSVSFFATPAVAADQTLDRAYAARPERRQVVALQQRAGLEERSAADARLPRLSITAGWMEQGLSPLTIIPVYQYQGNIDIPIFTGGRIQAERAKAAIAIRQLKEQERDVRDRIALEVKTAIAQVDSARSEVEVANLGIQLAREEVQQARDRFQAGVANNVEVIQAQDELSRASDNQIAALYRYNQARASVAHATGQMELLYAK
jgi:outer membrane protein